MKLQALQRFINAITECDQIIGDINNDLAVSKKYSPSAREALVGAMIERKNNLIEQLRLLGVEIDVEV